MDLPGQSTSGRRETGRIRGINEVKGPMDNRELMETTGVITRESTGVTGCYQGEGDRMDEDKYGERQEGQKGNGYNMGGYAYGNSNNQRDKGYNGTHQMGHQINHRRAEHLWNGRTGSFEIYVESSCAGLGHMNIR